LQLPSAAVECVAAVVFTGAEWVADSGVVGWVAAFVGARSGAASVEWEEAVSVPPRLVPAFAAASAAVASGVQQLAVFAAEQLAEVALAG
jgi:hypothetical protein